MLQSSWHLAHSLLSPYLNIGLLLPGEVVNAAQEAFRSGKVPINSAEGFIRQVIGWREFMWNCYWRWMPEYKDLNALQATRPLPPLFTRSKPTPMRCMQSALEHVHDRAYAHHIERLMVLGNFALISGVNPQQFTPPRPMYSAGHKYLTLSNPVAVMMTSTSRNSPSLVSIPFSVTRTISCVMSSAFSCVSLPTKRSRN